MYHLDSSSDVVRLNVFNSEDVRFMFISLQLQETICRKLACVQTCPAGPNRSAFVHQEPGGALFDDENIEFKGE